MWLSPLLAGIFFLDWLNQRETVREETVSEQGRGSR
jgi:hypothetical protein